MTTIAEIRLSSTRDILTAESVILFRIPRGTEGSGKIETGVMRSVLRFSPQDQASSTVLNALWAMDRGSRKITKYRPD